MPAYNFNPRFANLVAHGYKRQTIRQTDRGAREGQTAYLYVGMRTKRCRKLRTGTITEVCPIEIGRNGCGEPYATVWYSGMVGTDLTHLDLDSFAADDGFCSGAEMVGWFEAQYRLPFHGYLHKWEPHNIE